MAAKKSTNTHPSEHQEAVGFMAWWRAQFPAVLIYHIPNGEKRSISVAKRLKAEGVRKGVPDYHVPAWRLWIELKRVSGGRLSKEQKEIIDYLRGVGDTVIVARGAADASRQVMEFLKEMR